MDSKLVFYVLIYWITYGECLLTNISRHYQELPSINEGEPCVKGNMYKMSCNTCHCSDNNVLYCTKMACLDDEDMIRLKRLQRQNLRGQRREGSERSNKEDETYLPILPEGPCVPGRIYRQGCQMCYCDEKGKSACSASSTTGCKEYPKPEDVVSPIVVSPQISNEEFWRYPILPHSAAPCESGKMYMVTCNACLCLDNGNLLCEKLLCLDQEEVNHSNAKKWSGTSCKAEDPSMSTRCVRCECLNSVTQCHAVPGCVAPKVLKLHGDSKTRLSLNPKKEKCEPGTGYKVDCNHCFCQEDRSLRCTQKNCLNYRQVQMLKKKRLYLEKHGL
ncbi:unnamed protein product, partial [Iphiclides podalirius]